MLKLAHKNLKVWRRSIYLIKIVYEITKLFPKDEQFSLISQMQRAAVSVASNIAEGFSRISKQEKIRFIEISRSSLVELDTHFESCIEIGYCSVYELVELDKLLNHIFAMLTKLMRTVK